MKEDENKKIKRITELINRAIDNSKKEKWEKARGQLDEAIRLLKEIRGENNWIAKKK